MSQIGPNRLRRGLMSAALLAGPTSALAGSARPSAVVVEQTYLKAEPGLVDSLTRYLVANWFVMDQRGVETGIFTNYALHQAMDAEPDWDLMMAVGYPQAAGYADPATQAAFTAIRAAHREVLIDGRNLRALGRVVRQHRFRVVGP